MKIFVLIKWSYISQLLSCDIFQINLGNVRLYHILENDLPNALNGEGNHGSMYMFSCA